MNIVVDSRNVLSPDKKSKALDLHKNAERLVKIREFFSHKIREVKEPA